MYYNKDGSGHAIAFNSVSVASALEAVLAGTARPQQSRNILERALTVRYCFLLIFWALTYASRPPFICNSI